MDTKSLDRVKSQQQAYESYVPLATMKIYLKHIVLVSGFLSGTTCSANKVSGKGAALKSRKCHRRNENGVFWFAGCLTSDGSRLVLATRVVLQSTRKSFAVCFVVLSVDNFPIDGPRQTLSMTVKGHGAVFCRSLFSVQFCPCLKCF